MKVKIYNEKDVKRICKKGQKLIKNILKNEKLKFLIFDNQSVFDNKKDE